MFFRSCITCIGIFLLILFLGQKVEIPQIKNSLPFLALNGILIFGIEKILWLEGIHRISIAKANAIAIFSPLLTLVLAVLILNQPILSKQLLAFVPMAVGLWLLTNKAKNSNE
jgi:drug/metabolite transporter (DMT)-like permease